jgi:hypothetical protein
MDIALPRLIAHTLIAILSILIDKRHLETIICFKLFDEEAYTSLLAHTRELYFPYSVQRTLKGRRRTSQYQLPVNVDCTW